MCLASVYRTHVPGDHTVDHSHEVSTFQRGLRLRTTKIAVTGLRKQTSRKWRTSAGLQVTGNESSGSRVYSANCKLGLTGVRPSLMSAPKTLGNWADRRIHVGTRSGAQPAKALKNSEVPFPQFSFHSPHPSHVHPFPASLLRGPPPNQLLTELTETTAKSLRALS